MSEYYVRIIIPNVVFLSIERSQSIAALGFLHSLEFSRTYFTSDSLGIRHTRPFFVGFELAFV